ncbi:hypothetical protein DXA14_11785 [Hungatella hathewayi]|jgi:hypothetical protein|uniref:Uncharacterized protein n=1 Tax=Hungatella hathewayi DSM 13479 TaxID=566550 RepID=D3AK92_9FIRM|nr:hypothetical protein CLOSTHATH_04035 [Hungatella hathewayi DSM 13479]RGZ04466.1 hypothetical protein DXA14_11785 [Hungatella hathewayi]RHB64444.1 hypothetical protein DW876_26550 [Hungatella hathewayi]
MQSRNSSVKRNPNLRACKFKWALGSGFLFIPLLTKQRRIPSIFFRNQRSAGPEKSPQKSKTENHGKHEQMFAKMKKL